MSKTKIFVITLIAFVGGMFTHNQIYAKIQTPALNLPQLPTYSGKASWYSRRSPGVKRHTASNEIFDDTAYTAAMWGVPFNQMVRVTNLDNGKSVVVRVNDRGPHKRYVKKGRVIDLSRRAFADIASTKHGVINVSVELL